MYDCYILTKHDKNPQHYYYKKFIVKNKKKLNCKSHYKKFMWLTILMFKVRTI
jgi:hypothetical protein